jgi:hypothetical protein
MKGHNIIKRIEDEGYQRGCITLVNRICWKTEEGKRKTVGIFLQFFLTFESVTRFLYGFLRFSPFFAVKIPNLS